MKTIKSKTKKTPITQLLDDAIARQEISEVKYVSAEKAEQIKYEMFNLYNDVGYIN